MTQDLISLSQIVQNFAVAIGFLLGGMWAVYQFGIQRGNQTGLKIDTDIKISSLSGEDKRRLVFIDVILENTGKRALFARTKKLNSQFAQKPCSLYLRKVNANSLPNSHFYWYSSDLSAIDGVPEEINLTREYGQDPRNSATFFIEPSEVYHIGNSFILSPGVYLGRIRFFGARGRQEFWSRVFSFSVEE